MAGARSWWAPDRHADRRPFLAARARIVKRVRRHFEAEGFTEVEPAMLGVSPGNEAHLHAFDTSLVAPGGARRRLYLHTSPEFACKKLLTAGEERIYSFGKVFRNRERGDLHHPEFTMLEWYRARAPYESLMTDCTSFVVAAAEEAQTQLFTFRGRTADPFATPERMTVAAAFREFAGIDLLDTLEGPTPDRGLLSARAEAAGMRTGKDDTWSDIFSRIMVAIEPHLGIGRPLVLDRYPVCEAALARPASDDPRVAERFEVYCCGVELANGFGELTDPIVQRARFEAEMDEKERVYAERHPLDDDFLAALGRMPPASGVALGFDRLVMLATGASRIEQVIWTPVPEV